MRGNEISKLSRRHMLGWAGGMGAALAGGLTRSGAALAADTYPTHNIRLIVPFGPGGGVDITARLLAQFLSDDLGHAVVVENMGGGGGVLGSDYVVHAEPDGYTLVMHTSSSAVMNGLLYKKMPYDFVTAFTPISEVDDSPTLVLTSASLPAKTLQEFIALTKANPGKYNYGTTGVGTDSQMLSLLFCKRLGLNMVDVAYKGTGDLMKDLLAGVTQMSMGVAGPFLPGINAGTLRALCVNGSKRIPVLPDVPTAAEAGLPNFENPNWYALYGPAGLPQPIVQRLYQGVAKAVADPTIKQKLINLGLEPVGSSPAELDKYWHDQTALWQPVVQASGISLSQ